MIQKIKYKYRRIVWSTFGYPEAPPRDFVYLGSEFLKSQVVVLRYLKGEQIYSIAQDYNVTRERVRQIVWKYYRTYERSLNA